MLLQKVADIIAKETTELLITLVCNVCNLLQVQL